MTAVKEARAAPPYPFGLLRISTPARFSMVMATREKSVSAPFSAVASYQMRPTA
jgi:hypothetical protein